MVTQQILEALAPCGLSCEKCFANVNGDIRTYGMKLKEKLGNFGIYAKRFETLIGDPVFKKYPDFKEMLDYLVSKNCQGCRHEQCKLFEDCGVRPCHQEKNIDYCYECDEFPCNKTGFDEHLHARWIKLNERIREVGIEEYYAETKNQPRYA
jgi:hypothetical protein